MRRARIKICRVARTWIAGTRLMQELECGHRLGGRCTSWGRIATKRPCRPCTEVRIREVGEATEAERELELERVYRELGFRR